MSMVFCRGCGHQIHESAPACPKCGAPQSSLKSTTAAAGQMIEGLSDSWKNKFILIEKAGGVKLPNIKKLTFGERSKIITNIFGFLFGPIYYIIKGMWKKAITLTLISAIIVFCISIIAVMFGKPSIANMANFIGAAIFGSRANIDYFKKIRMNDDGWI